MGLAVDPLPQEAMMIRPFVPLAFALAAFAWLPVAAPAEDQGALESDVREALKRRAVRTAASIEARLGRGKSTKKDKGDG